ncbi:MAG: glycerol-3-phosphate dehydrogenase/oxidase [Myxococcales bacterium]|nr:glycerol-3-phosphate dehydrogenase/oxidase [Myxococcales bacterium]
MKTPNAQREAALQRLATEAFDVLVVGGGITGCGAARDAAARGLKVALVEKTDFGAGTSSRSSKLIHGGLRYLEHAEFGLVFESVNERKRLMSLGRHLVRPLPFLVTNYKGDRRFLPTLAFGLWIYDALCLFGNYRNHRTFGPTKTRALEPKIKSQGLRGGILYYDCLTDDARLTLENALDARALGAVVLNHARAGQVLKDGTGRVVGLVVEDVESGKRIEVRSKLVINASGPWSDEVRALASLKGILKPTKGVHVVVDDTRLPVKHALMLQSPRDKRVVFCIPWGLGRTVIGTTDTFFDGSPDKLEPTFDDVDYLLETANAFFLDAHLAPADVLATWSGLRPLLKPEDESASASAVSREHLIDVQPGFVTIAGGKLTTYRNMAAELIDACLPQLGVETKCQTKHRPLPGAVGLTESDAQLDALARTLATRGLDAVGARYLVETYGARAASVLARGEADAEALFRLDSEHPALLAQVDEAVDTELARTLDDVLARRIPLVLRARDQGLGVAERVARRMASRLGWSAERTAQELAAFRSVVDESRAFRRQPQRHAIAS